MERPSTKERIMETAIVLFSDSGYDKVTMRDIAALAGIKAASIYNHFPSKWDILKDIYELYAREYRAVIPSIETLLYRMETEPIQDMLTALDFSWPPRIQDMMDRIILIASQRIGFDKDSENFVQDNFFQPLREIWVPFLNQAIKLGKIEPIDTESFTHLVIHFAFSAATLNRSAMKTSKEQWQKVLTMLFSLLKPQKKELS